MKTSILENKKKPFQEFSPNPYAEDIAFGNKKHEKKQFEEICDEEFNALSSAKEKEETTADPKFKNFDKATFDDSVAYRTANPAAIDQNRTNTCGIAAVAFLFAQGDPDLYAKTMQELYEKGTATVNGYTIKPDDHLFDMSMENDEYPKYKSGKKMDPADWILLSSIRDTENDLWDYDGQKEMSESITGMTAPYIVTGLMTNMLGMTDVENKTNVVIKSNGLEGLKTIENQFSAGKAVIMLINSNMFENKTRSSAASHYVVYQGGLYIDDANQKVSFSVFTWGEIKHITVSYEAFKDNFYGTITGQPKKKE